MDFEILFLGTGAADRMELEQENDFEDKDKRRCSATLINGHILIDCGPHIINSLSVAKIPLAKITNILITHLHKDHFCENSIVKIAEANPNLKIWIREDAKVSLPTNCSVQKMKCFEPYSISELKVTTVPANHEAYPQHFSIECNDRKLFYGLDGAWFLGDSIRFMKNQKYDMFIFDATVGDYLGDYRLGEHNSIPMIRMLIPSMKTLNIIDENTRLVLSHLAVCLHKPYTETYEITKNDNLTVAFDGLKLRI